MHYYGLENIVVIAVCAVAVLVSYMIFLTVCLRLPQNSIETIKLSLPYYVYILPFEPRPLLFSDHTAQISAIVDLPQIEPRTIESLQS